MEGLTAADVLNVWEHGRHQSPEQRAILLLAASQPEQSSAQVAALSIGRRDAQLLSLREWTFGPHASCLADCPQCALRVQIDLTLDDLRVPMPDPAESWAITVGEAEVRYRLPTSLDLIAVARLGEVGAIRNALLERCLAEVTLAGQPQPISDLPQDLIDTIEADMEQRDPQAHVQLALTCPECAHAWSALFDIPAFFWAEISARAEQLLYEVHALASAYGWREADILSMSAFRRQAYLELINA
jgi:hypothetical protein